MKASIPGSIGSSWPREEDKRRLVAVLTWLGVIPFAILIPFLNTETSALLFRVYSLAIFAFLCGTWWATALIAGNVTILERVAIILCSNLLVIVAVCLLIVPLSWALLLLSALFLTQAIAERQLRVFARQPTYYRRVRLSVSSAVAVLHLVGWISMTTHL